MYKLKDLERQGYIVVRDFLTSKEIDSFNRIYQPNYSQFVTTHNPSSTSTYPVLPNYSVNAVPSVSDKINELTKLIARFTSVKAELLSRLYPMDNNFVNFGWHQDADLFFIYQEMFNSLNFWIPIHKKNPATANLKVVPFDKLKILDKTLHDYVIGKGATKFSNTESNTSIFEFYENPKTYKLPYRLDEIEDTPELNEGDLLLMRGDVIHKSQQSTDHRIALSFRSFNKDGLIYKDKFYHGMDNGSSKRKYIERSPANYKQLFAHFEHHNSLPIPLIDIN